jgi:hypothetical protein
MADDDDLPTGSIWRRRSFVSLLSLGIAVTAALSVIVLLEAYARSGGASARLEELKLILLPILVAVGNAYWQRFMGAGRRNNKPVELRTVIIVVCAPVLLVLAGTLFVIAKLGERMLLVASIDLIEGAALIAAAFAATYTPAIYNLLGAPRMAAGGAVAT